jgi:glycosyltransferase involved in cell wall biosynthesis
MNDHFYRSSGAAIAIRRIAEASDGVDYYIAGCENKGYPEDLSWVPEGRYRRFSLTSANPLRVLRDLRRFRVWFRAMGLNLVHCHHRRVSVLLQLAGLPVIYTGQLVFGQELWFRLLRPKRMTAITKSVAMNLLLTTGRKPIACISNPVDFPAAPPHIDQRTVRFRAVCIARLEPVKGHQHLLAAWKVLRDRGHEYQLDLIGEGSLKANLEAQAKRDGISHLVRFCGFRENVADAIRESLFAVLVSEFEGQGIVTLEAAAAGRPTLLTAVPGSLDLLPPHRVLPNSVDYGNVIELANAIEEWFSKPEQVVEEGRLFFDYLKGECNPAIIAEKYRMVYQRALAGLG